MASVASGDLTLFDSLDGVNIFDGLSMQDLARIAQSNQDFQDILLSGRQQTCTLWYKAVSCALPGFQLAEELFQRPREFLALLGRFLKATALTGEDDVWMYKVLGVKPSVLRLTRMRDAQLLYDRLKNANQTALEHVQGGGTYVKVFLAQLVIPALASKVRFLVDRDMDSDEEGFNPDLVFGRPIVLPAHEAPQVPPELAAATHRGRLGRRNGDQGDDQGPRPLRLHFARLQHQLLMAARDDNAPPAAIPPPHQHFDWNLRRPVPPGSGMKVVADVSIADLTHQLFHFRGITMNVNGPWVDCCGLYAPATGQDVFMPTNAPQGGACCIICLRDDFGAEPSDSSRGSRSGGMGPGGDTFGVAKLPDALHLDSLRTPGSWPLPTAGSRQ